MKHLIILPMVVVMIFIGGHTGVSAQTPPAFEIEAADYELPHPGMLPDHPLYFIKQIRDAIDRASADEPKEKAAVYLEQSDKLLAMAEPLAKKGKLEMAIETVIESRDIFKESIEITREIPTEEQQDEIEQHRLATGEGSIAEGDTISREEKCDLLIRANRKHIETIENLMKDAPSGMVERLETLRQEAVDFENEIKEMQ